MTTFLRYRGIGMVALVLCVSACDSAPVAGGKIAPGSDRDAHGCIPSAGYAWCERTAKCERPWELAKERGLPSTADAFDQYCRAPAGS
ncbi:hypothetical protein [Burkholderia alba]|uniref:hypothetical protein n=1 Tax=Burkholderia alba TaxID=2683677 RepID=UPI002B05C477|nr:hypothetical protein [Burkholderia alba]